MTLGKYAHQNCVQHLLDSNCIYSHHLDVERRNCLFFHGNAAEAIAQFYQTNCHQQFIKHSNHRHHHHMDDHQYHQVLQTGSTAAAAASLLVSSQFCSSVIQQSGMFQSIQCCDLQYLDVQRRNCLFLHEDAPAEAILHSSSIRRIATTILCSQSLSFSLAQAHKRTSRTMLLKPYA